MRGPKLPVFVNSGIADSRALRIEWKDLSGAPRCRYVQAARSHVNYDLQNAARGQLWALSQMHIYDSSPFPNPYRSYALCVIYI